MIYLISILTIFIILPATLVAIGLPFKQYLGMRYLDDGVSIPHYDLPNWLKWLQNPEDGLTGDSRGWYWNVKMKGKPAWFKMWWWSGVRNTYNYLKRFIIGIDIRKFTFHKLCGADYVRDDLINQGFQILYAKPKDGWFPRPMLYWVRQWGDSNRAIVLQIGWKIKLEHNGTAYEDEWDYYKGLTFEPNPYKDIS